MTVLWLMLACGGAVERPLATRMAPCPPTPNCVSSLADPSDEQHHVAPLRAGLDEVRRAALRMPRTRIIAEDEGWVHIVASTPVLRFHDDLELLQAGEVVHVRSASRIGRADLGVNRRRVESLRGMLAQAVPPAEGGDDVERGSP